jgi:hypothetical protein
MSKFQLYFATIAIAGFTLGCQQAPSAPTEKSINYLRSQLNLSPSLEIVAESQQPQPANVNDLCQTSEPTQAGFAIKLIAEDIRYTLQTNQDASKIEICGSEDAKPSVTGKYNGAGYTLRYPASWQAIDLGLEPSGASTVIFTPSREIKGANAQIIQELQQSQQIYVLVARQPIKNRISTASENPKDIVNLPFDAKVKGAKSGSKQEFKIAIADTSGSSQLWKVRVLTLEVDDFFYTVSYYQPNSQSDDGSQTFEQFANSFSLIQTP